MAGNLTSDGKLVLSFKLGSYMSSPGVEATRRIRLTLLAVLPEHDS